MVLTQVNLSKRASTDLPSKFVLATNNDISTFQGHSGQEKWGAKEREEKLGRREAEKERE